MLGKRYERARWECRPWERREVGGSFLWMGGDRMGGARFRLLLRHVRDVSEETVDDWVWVVGLCGRVLDFVEC